MEISLKFAPASSLFTSGIKPEDMLWDEDLTAI
jgi:hypothetical protein